MADMMKVAVMTELGKLEIQQRPVPVPKKGEVLVKLEYIGVCGSDLHYFESGRIGDFVVELPFVLGHECSGSVVGTGEGVKTLAVGDRITIEPGLVCGTCKYCKSGRYNLCPDMEFFATPPYDGVFQEYVAYPENQCFKLPDSISTLEGALMEPLAVGFHAAAQADAHLGQTALVLGSGCIGLVSLLALKAKGVGKVIISDVLDVRLAKAKELGADVVLNSKTDDVLARVLEETGGEGVDIVIDTAGLDVCMEQAVRGTCMGGTIVCVGYPPSGNTVVPMSVAINKELTIKTIFRYRNTYPLEIDAVAGGKVNLKGLVTDIFDFDDIQNAMDRSLREKDRIVKAVIKM